MYDVAPSTPETYLNKTSDSVSQKYLWCLESGNNLLSYRTQLLITIHCVQGTASIIECPSQHGQQLRKARNLGPSNLFGGSSTGQRVSSSQSCSLFIWLLLLEPRIRFRGRAHFHNEGPSRNNPLVHEGRAFMTQQLPLWGVRGTCLKHTSCVNTVTPHEKIVRKARFPLRNWGPQNLPSCLPDSTWWRAQKLVWGPCFKH